MPIVADTNNSANSAVDEIDFVHLHNHTHYSLLDGLQKVPSTVERAKQLGMHSLAITDHGTLSGAIEFFKACKSSGIKPIIGMEAYVAARKHTDKNTAEDRNPYHLTLLAKNMDGYKNLMKMMMEDGLFKFLPKTDDAWVYFLKPFLKLTRKEKKKYESNK